MFVGGRRPVGRRDPYVQSFGMVIAVILAQRISMTVTDEAELYRNALLYTIICNAP